MADPPPRYYWDSCAWIGFINEEADKLTPLRQIWKNAQRAQCEIWTSTFTYIEVMRGQPGYGQAYPPEEEDARVFAMIEQPFVHRVQVDTEVAKMARSFKRAHHPTLSKRADAIHLATAAYANADELHTWDKSDLLPFDGKITRRDGRPLKICVPQAIPEGPLFALPGQAADDESQTD